MYEQDGKNIRKDAGYHSLSEYTVLRRTESLIKIEAGGESYEKQ